MVQETEFTGFAYKKRGERKTTILKVPRIIRNKTISPYTPVFIFGFKTMIFPNTLFCSVFRIFDYLMLVLTLKPKRIKRQLQS